MSLDSQVEEWRPVVGYDGQYSVSSAGRVRCEMKKQGTYPGRIMKPSINKGYPMVILHYSAGKYKNHSVHSLVAAAFIGPRPDGYDVNHIDGVRSNARFENLEYCTRSENQFHAKRVMLSAVGSNNGTAKLNEEIVARCRELFALGTHSVDVLGKTFGVDPSVMGRAIRRITWRHVQ